MNTRFRTLSRAEHEMTRETRGAGDDFSFEARAGKRTPVIHSASAAMPGGDGHVAGDVAG